MRLIDADALDMYERLKSYYGDAWRDAQEEIDNAPTVDAVPVIRCKDCKHFTGKWCILNSRKEFDPEDRLVNGEGFCAWAERKEE